MGNDLIKAVQEWSKERGLDNNDPAKQLNKLQEEIDELKEAYKNHDFSNANSGFPDSIGDVMVVMIVLCQQTGFDLKDCLELAVDTIKNRKGKTLNGVFIKDEGE